MRQPRSVLYRCRRFRPFEVIVWAKAEGITKGEHYERAAAARQEIDRNVHTISACYIRYR